MGQDLLRVLRFTLSVSVHQCTVSTSILNALLRERETVEACEIKEMLFWLWQVWIQLQIENVAVFEVLILFFGFFFLETHEHQGLLTVHGVLNININ